MGIFNMMELANTQQADANKPDEVVEVNKNEAGKVDGDTTIIKNQNNVIELKGSLSEVYTKALNAEYALENIQSIVSSIVDSKSENELNPMYVHIADAEEIENQDPLAYSKDLRIALDKHNGKKSMVVLEGDLSGYKAQLIKDYVVSIGVECVQGREAAISKMQAFLEK